MEYISSIFINKIIHNFKDVATSVKPREQEFVVIIFKKTIKQWSRKSHANIIFGNTMLERRLIEHIFSDHILIILDKLFICNGR